MIGKLLVVVFLVFLVSYVHVYVVQLDVGGMAMRECEICEVVHCCFIF